MMMYKKMLVLGLALALSTIATQVTSAALITSIERRNSFNTYPQIAGPLVENASAFVDRMHTYVMIPPHLVGAEYIRVSNDDKHTPNYELDVTLSQPAILYLLLDNRMGHGYMLEESGYLLDPDLYAAGMSWVINAGFVDTGDDIVTQEVGTQSPFRWSSVYAKDVSAGTITLFQQYDVTHQGTRNMYAVAAVPATAPGETIYVDADAGGANNGSSWTDAYRYLQNGLAAAVSGDEIRVAQGIYKPDEDGAHPSGTGNREATFQLKNGVVITGGYAGFGEPDPNARDVEGYETVLSGDLLGNDGPDFANNDENSYHVVTGSGTDATAVLDGFTMTAGNANSGYPNDAGGGMKNHSGSPTVINCSFRSNSAIWGGGMENLVDSAPTITDCKFSGNVATGRNGGGMNNNNSNPTLTNCTFIANWAERSGGGMSNIVASSPTLTGCTFSENSASVVGGGMYNGGNSNPMLTKCTFSRNWTGQWGGAMCVQDSTPELTNCTFLDNSADKGGGGIDNYQSGSKLTNCIFRGNSAGQSGGGVFNSWGSYPTMTNCIFTENSAYLGGGMFNWHGCSPTLVNCTFSGNSASHGNAMGCDSDQQGPSNPQLSNCILWDGVDGIWNNDNSVITITYSDIQGGWPGAGNINADPCFVEPAIGDYHLLPGSPCIDTGNNSAVPSSVVTDLDGAPRIRGHAVDMGVYESIVVLFVDAAAPGPTHNGSSWATAFRCLQDALADALSGDEIHVAQGTYTPEGPPPDIRQASNPNPADGATGISRTADLSWTAGLDATSHDVYFGTTNPPPFMQNQTNTTFDPGTMAYSTLYYWRIDEVGVYGTITGTVWSFRTVGGGPSMPPSLPPPLDRESTFQLINDVVIKGGYAGFGEQNPDARDIEAYETILSGDIGIVGNNSDNSYHVVTGSGANQTAVLDGFTITGGNANGSSENTEGGGMRNESGSPTLINCTFTGNSANGDGGGMYNISSNPMLANCTFSGNSAGSSGGGMYNYNDSSPTLANCTFSGNSAQFGGGMFNYYNSSPTITNCTFSGNWAWSWAGGMENYYQSSPTVTNCTFSGNSGGGYGGGMQNWQSNPTVTNCIFSGNSADVGGGMDNFDGGNPTLTNCTFSNNSASQGGGIWNFWSNPTLANCILWGNAAPIGPQIYNDETSLAIVDYSDVQGGWPGQGNINANPLFVDPAIGDYHLLEGSPCINTGDPNYIAGPNETDLDGKPRVIAGRIDMGAHEFNHNPIADAGPDQTVEAQAPWGATVTLDGSGSSDADSTPGTNDDINDLNWYDIDPCDPNADVLLGSGRILDCNLSIGEHIILLEVIDKAGASDTNEVTIIVQDTTPPDINCPPDVTLECPADTTPSATGNATATDTCGTVTITHSDQWQPSCGNAGTLARTWTATDESGNSSTCVQIITVVDTTPPAITCPADVTLECPADTSVEANGSATAIDTCGTVTITHSDQWQPSCGNTGTLTRTWTATDECGNSSSCMQTITVVDTTPPEFQFSVAPTMLWPPDHKMVLITPSWTVSDDRDAEPEVSLVSIIANEGDDTIGDGHTSNDIQIGEDGTIYLRSERSGTSDDRVYTITYQAVDDCGNTTIRSATVSIPHDFKVLARIADRWLWAGQGNIPEDLNDDGVVNLKDIAIFANNWIQ